MDRDVQHALRELRWLLAHYEQQAAHYVSIDPFPALAASYHDDAERLRAAVTAVEALVQERGA